MAPAHDTTPCWPADLPLLPLRDALIFPTTGGAVAVGQERSMKLVTEAAAGSGVIAVVAQRDAHAVATERADLLELGTLAKIHEVVRTAESAALHVVVQGLERIRVVDLTKSEPYLVARMVAAPEIHEHGMEVEALAGAARGLFGRMVAIDSVLPNELIGAVRLLDDAKEVAYFVAANTPLAFRVRQEILEIEPHRLART